MRAFWLMLDIGYYIGLPLLWYVIPATWWCLRQLSRPCVFLWLILVFGCASPPEHKYEAERDKRNHFASAGKMVFESEKEAQTGTAQSALPITDKPHNYAIPGQSEGADPIRYSCGDDCGGESQDILETIWPGQVIY